MLTLYTYFRSSAAYRVRIALHLKGLPYTSVPVHLLRDGGEQHAPAYAQLNPTELVPTLVDGELALGQSLAIMEYLEEQHPAPPLLPGDAVGRARVRALAQSIACDIHPLNNLRVLQYLKNQLQQDETSRQQWSQHWITLGLSALEAQLQRSPATGRFCHGDTPTLADCCLIPQLFNARRIETPLDAYPTLLRIESACLALDAFQRAAPHAQADAA
jgi:maleylacetoacetate isomerase